LPLRVDVPLQWQYRLNETVARAVDQGALSHLLVVRYLAAHDYGLDRKLLGVHPGVLFTPVAGGTDADLKECEIDVLAIFDGLPMVCECKEDGAKLTERDVEKLLNLARRLDKSTVILATPKDFSQAQGIVNVLRPELGNIRLMVLEDVDMLDPRPHHSLEQQDPAEYLRDVVKRLRRPDRV
jgi:hypothetical protein